MVTLPRFCLSAVLTCLLLLPAQARGDSIPIAWDANTEPDVAGYVVYYRTTPITGTGTGQYDGSVDVGTSTTWTFPSAAPGQTYYFRVQAYNTSGLTSALSNEVSDTIPVAPDPTPAPSPGPAPGPGPDARLSLNRATLNLGAIGGTNATRTPSQHAMVTITNATTSPAWTVTADAVWVAIMPASGTGGGTFAVSVKNGTYDAGTNLTATVTVSAPGVPNSPVTLPVTLRIRSAGASPTGLIETPLANASGITGAIPVTGWALDDIGIKAVTIWRDPVAGETSSAANGKIFIGRAMHVDGARPDVDAIYEHPYDYQAGWGYMLLTNMLPDQGNGTFTLHVFAEDLDGHTVSLGSRTIVCSNASARKPFGTIDTPDQGGTVSGTLYTSFGWALTPQPNTIPTNGSSIMVFIDGVPVGRPVYNLARSDISTLFPGRTNSSGAVGYFQFDTTRLANGVHTIAWSVSDNGGNAEGIGSRYFTVLNASSTSSLTLDASASTQAAAGGDPEVRSSAVTGANTGESAAMLASLPMSVVPVYTRTGFDPGASLDIVETDSRGVAQVTAVEASRFEMTLGPAAAGDNEGYEGYLVADGRLEPLPAGAFLDRKSGDFFWQPGVGFVGAYQLLFIRTADGMREQIPVDVTIAPRTKDADRQERDRIER